MIILVIHAPKVKEGAKEQAAAIVWQGLVKALKGEKARTGDAGRKSSAG